EELRRAGDTRPLGARHDRRPRLAERAERLDGERNLASAWGQDERVEACEWRRPRLGEAPEDRETGALRLGRERLALPLFEPAPEEKRGAPDLPAARDHVLPIVGARRACHTDRELQLQRGDRR